MDVKDVMAMARAISESQKQDNKLDCLAVLGGLICAFAAVFLFF